MPASPLRTDKDQIPAKRPPAQQTGAPTSTLGRLSGAVRNGSIGTLGGDRQARTRGIAQDLCKLLTRQWFRPSRDTSGTRLFDPMHLALYDPTSPRIPARFCGLRLPRGRGPHHRAGRLPGFRPCLPPRRHGLSGSGDADAPCFLGGIRALAADRSLRLVLFTTRATTSYLDHRFTGARRAAVRPRIRRRPRRGPCRRRCAAHRSRCGRACARSMSRWPARWWSARRCGRRAAVELTGSRNASLTIPSGKRCSVATVKPSASRFR